MVLAFFAPGVRKIRECLKTWIRFSGPFNRHASGEPQLSPGLLETALELCEERFGFARGTYAADPSDGLKLVDARITNAVRCLPPLNKPTGVELATCRKFLTASIAEMPNLRAIVALGRIAHNSVVAALGARPKDASFGHGAAHTLGRLRLYDSYHCSRYNTNTGVLTAGMFHDVFAAVRAELDGAQPARPASREVTSR